MFELYLKRVSPSLYEQDQGDFWVKGRDSEQAQALVVKAAQGVVGLPTIMHKKG